MATRLDAIHAAEQSGCKMTVVMEDGRPMRFPMMIAAEGAVAAQEGKSEEQWRREYTRGLVTVAAKHPDDETVEGVAATLNCTDAAVRDMKWHRVWPWLERKKPNVTPIPKRA